jgi:protein-disulfide isomerase
MLRGHHEYGRTLGIQGTPVVIVNGKLIPGYAPIDNILANL